MAGRCQIYDWLCIGYVNSYPQRRFEPWESLLLGGSVITLVTFLNFFYRNLLIFIEIGQKW